MDSSANRIEAQNAATARRCQPLASLWVDRLLDCLLPQLCLNCGDEPASDGLCKSCEACLPWQESQCPRCALPQAQDRLCGACLRRTPPQHAAWAAMAYQAPVADLLQQLKFAAAIGVASALGRRLARRLETLPFESVDYLVPAPLHLRRLRQRGFNQALELCRPLAIGHGLEIRADLLRRQRDTAEQTRLNAAQRRRNLKDAFACTTSLDGEHVLIFDDVMTTGATMQAMTQALLSAGAGRVSCMAMARAA